MGIIPTHLSTVTRGGGGGEGCLTQDFQQSLDFFLTEVLRFENVTRKRLMEQERTEGILFLMSDFDNTQSVNEDPSLQIESFATINLLGVFTKLYFNIGLN